MPADIRLDADGGERLVLQGRVIAVDGRLNLKAVEVQGPRVLPTEANFGDIYMLITSEEGFGNTIITTTTLWLCVPPSSPSVQGGSAVWREIRLGDEVVSP
jgi:hypothetical protein